MAQVTATVVIDQADDPEVRFSSSTFDQVVELDVSYRGERVATIGFSSDRDAPERFALWLESVAALVRSEAELVERDEQLAAAGDAAIDEFIWGGVR